MFHKPSACTCTLPVLLLATGTGKTLVARALANECSVGQKRVAFFMRKGADCLSKWVGESERQLRLLFDQVCNLKKNMLLVKSRRIYEHFLARLQF